jgi:hypothetical protein
MKYIYNKYVNQMNCSLQKIDESLSYQYSSVELKDRRDIKMHKKLQDMFSFKD